MHFTLVGREAGRDEKLMGLSLLILRIRRHRFRDRRNLIKDCRVSRIGMISLRMFSAVLILYGSDANEYVGILRRKGISRKSGSVSCRVEILEPFPEILTLYIWAQCNIQRPEV